MNRNSPRPLSVILALIAIALGGWQLAAQRPATAPASTTTPDFAAMTPVAARKEAFFRWLAPLVAEENRRLELLRQRLERFRRGLQVQDSLPAHDLAFLGELADRYRTAPPEGDLEPMVTALLRRIDGVPVRLALVQGAVESGWGTGRFAREANNYFGVWTWRHAGIVPERRPEGANHAVAAYPDARASIRAYLYTLDVGAVYDEFRRLRAVARAAGREPEAYDLAAGLGGYSERGQDYVAEIRAMLRANRDLLDTVLEGS